VTSSRELSQRLLSLFYVFDQFAKVGKKNLCTQAEENGHVG
jgi:hypothetical protein